MDKRKDTDKMNVFGRNNEDKKSHDKELDGRFEKPNDNRTKFNKIRNNTDYVERKHSDKDYSNSYDKYSDENLTDESFDYDYEENDLTNKFEDCIEEDLFGNTCYKREHSRPVFHESSKNVFNSNKVIGILIVIGCIIIALSVKYFSHNALF